jgi:hypothetical protein
LSFIYPKVSRTLDIGSLFALGALHDVKGNLIAFLQRLETTHIDGGEMSEKIFAAIIGRNKTKTLGIVEPLDSTECHI